MKDQPRGAWLAYTDGVLLAILSDIHANLEALNACLEDARRFGARRYAFLGDLVGYGADPGAVVDIVAEHASRGAVVVKGNHDAAAAEGETDYLNHSASLAIEWTRRQLTGAQSQFIRELPLLVRDDDACFVHASASRPEQWDYVDSPRAAEKSAHAAARPCTFSGHVHEQRLFIADAQEHMVSFAPRAGTDVPLRMHRRCVALVGSVGQPRDGNTAAAYATADFERRVICFHRVPYDHVQAASKIRAAGLPESLAFRLERGV
jgi:diadenosine tetraphosphatase ApaH/serine/threonine PP2A family protein phosphatase